MKKTKFHMKCSVLLLILLLVAGALAYSIHQVGTPPNQNMQYYKELDAGLNSSYTSCLKLCTSPQNSNVTDMCAGLLYQKTTYYQWKDAYELSKQSGRSVCTINKSYPDECGALESRFLAGFCLTEADIGKDADFCRKTEEPLARDFCIIIKLREEVGYYPSGDAGVKACDAVGNEVVKRYCQEMYRRKE